MVKRASTLIKRLIIVTHSAQAGNGIIQFCRQERRAAYQYSGEWLSTIYIYSAF